jgi:predicted nucleotidyltransferase component of viral defense system
MLTLEQLKRYYVGIDQVSEKSILKEYIQYELLDSLFKEEMSKYLSFIGGTAIHVVYGSTRFSEDLDFDNFGLTFDDFENLSHSVTDDMKMKGFEVEFRTVEKGAYHCYVRFPHILQHSQISSDPGEKVLVRIDMMKKTKIFSPEIFQLNRFDIFRTILVNPVDILLAQKLITILFRKREKGRDFFDVSYLYGMTQPDFDYIEATTEIPRKEFMEKVVARCKELDFEALAQDVRPFLFKENQIDRVRKFQEFIEGKE